MGVATCWFAGSQVSIATPVAASASVRGRPGERSASWSSHSATTTATHSATTTWNRMVSISPTSGTLSIGRQGSATPVSWPSTTSVTPSDSTHATTPTAATTRMSGRRAVATAATTTASSATPT